MKKIIINDNNLKDEDIEKKVIRVKALIINSNNKILLAHNNNTFQFPGGHKEDNETLEECIKREIKEETGIDLEITEEPFLNITTYDNNYFLTGKKVLNTIYYYCIYTNEKPNFDNTHYDELEIQTDFNLFYVNLSNFSSFLQKNISSSKIDEKIGREMKIVYNEYNEIHN